MSRIKSRFHKNTFLVFVVDIALFIISYIGAYLLRFDFNLPFSEFLHLRNTVIPIFLLKLFVFYQFGLYKGMWRYTGLKDLENIIKASITSTSAIIIIILMTTRFHGFPRSVFLIDCILTIFLIGGFRLGIRMGLQYSRQGALPWQRNGDEIRKRKRVMIVGAGDAGEKILREINDNVSLNYHLIGFVDDDRSKVNRYIHGVKVLGTVDRIALLVEEKDLDEIIIAAPSASGEQIRRIVDLCRQTGIACKTIPGMGELINGKLSVSQIREVSYADLLGRSQVELDTKKIGGYLKGKRVLVTGAGGSIGSEFCRQVARFEPEILIMLDKAESSLYDIEMEMRRHFPGQRIAPVLTSVTCLDRIKRTFEEFNPDVVFHSAAYKHVPMMELHPCEAIYNNILGSKHMLETSIEYKVERFVLISTDKAVRPTNIMGTSKRVAELVLQSRHREMIEKVKPDRSCRTKIMAVRFGNVIGSVGSVIPLFMKQIADGGPVTVTDPRMTRYFMTINEAVQLILQAGAIGEGGEIFILKMGKPVKIIDMARDLIRLSGFEPDKDIKIRITGPRPGEKLYEELITEGEGIVPTLHDKIMVLKTNGHSKGMSYKELEGGIKDLLVLAVKNDIEGLKMKLRDMVPEYTPPKGQQIDEEAREEEKGHFEVIKLNIEGKEIPVDKQASLSERQKKECETIHNRL